MVSPFSFKCFCKHLKESYDRRAFSMPKNFPEKTGMLAHGFYVSKANQPLFFLKKE